MPPPTASVASKPNLIASNGASTDPTTVMKPLAAHAQGMRSGARFSRAAIPRGNGMPSGTPNGITSAPPTSARRAWLRRKRDPASGARRERDYRTYGLHKNLQSGKAPRLYRFEPFYAGG